MREECPKCRKLSAKIQAKDEFEAIKAAKDGKLSACCTICGRRWTLPRKAQKAWAERE
jgi:hypothetical protein